MNRSLTVDTKGNYLRPWTKVKCSLAAATGGLTNLPIDVLMLPLYTEIFGVPPYIAGLISLAAGLWDAITDPIVGRLSDRTMTRWGRRRPYLLFGAVPLGFSFWWLFNPIIGSIEASFLAAFILFRLSTTVVMIPLFSLGAELSTNYDERTSIMGYIRGFGVAGLLIGILIPVFLMQAFPDIMQAYQIMGITVGLASTILVLATFFGTREKIAQKKQSTASMEMKVETKTLQAIKQVIVDKPFLYALGGLVFGYTANGITATLLIYYAIHSLIVSEADIMITLPVFFSSALLSIAFVWGKLSAKYDKRIALVISLILSGTATGCFVFIPEGGLLLIIGGMFVAGIGFGGLQVIPYSMLAEVIDYNELKTGERWEGLYYGVWDFSRKLGINISKFLPMLALTLMGYVTAIEGQTMQQPQHVADGIRYMFSLGSAVLYFIGAMIVIKFPITREEHKKIRIQLDK